MLWNALRLFVTLSWIHKATALSPKAISRQAQQVPEAECFKLCYMKLSGNEADLLQGALRSFVHPVSCTWHGRSFREALSSHAMEKAKKCSWKRCLLSTLRSGSSYSCELLRLWVSSGIVQTMQCIHCVCVCTCLSSGACCLFISDQGARWQAFKHRLFTVQWNCSSWQSSLFSVLFEGTKKKKKKLYQMESWNFNVDV